MDGLPDTQDPILDNELFGRGDKPLQPPGLLQRLRIRRCRLLSYKEVVEFGDGLGKYSS